MQAAGEEHVVGDLLQGIGSGIGVFLGVVAGTAVTILAHRFQERRSEKRQVRNLDFELRLNMRKLDGWLEEMVRYRNAVNGDSLHNWVGSFDLGKALSAAADAMLRSGLLYDTLDQRHVEALQAVFLDLSPGGENRINQQLGGMRDVVDRLRRTTRNSPRWLQELGLRGTVWVSGRWRSL